MFTNLFESFRTPGIEEATEPFVLFVVFDRHKPGPFVATSFVGVVILFIPMQFKAVPSITPLVAKYFTAGAQCDYGSPEHQGHQEVAHISLRQW